MFPLLPFVCITMKAMETEFIPLFCWNHNRKRAVSFHQNQRWTDSVMTAAPLAGSVKITPKNIRHLILFWKNAINVLKTAGLAPTVQKSSISISWRSTLNIFRAHLQQNKKYKEFKSSLLYRINSMWDIFFWQVRGQIDFKQMHTLVYP